MTPDVTPPCSIHFGAIGNPKTYGWYRNWLLAAEDAGFELITSGDSQSLWADPFVTLSVASEVVGRCRLGVTVSNPRTRHPAVAAAALAALNDLAPRRIVFGLGSGDSALKNIGLPAGKVVDVEKYARAVKELCAGHSIHWQGADLKMQWTGFDLPIWMAAEGPRMQHLAGQMASGVLLSNALDGSVLARAVDNIAAGAASVGRSMDEIEIWCMAAMCFADSEEEGIYRLRSLLAGTANHVYRFHLDGKEVPEEYRAALIELRDGYDYRHHGSPGTAEENARLVERLGLVEFLANRSVIAGPPSRCLERMRELESIGVERLLVHHHANEPDEFMKAFRAGITPSLVAGLSR